MPRAGDLKDKITFQQRAIDDNDDKNGPWANIVTVSAQIQPLKGGEGVMASRLQGKQPFIIYVRASYNTRRIDNTFQAVDAHCKERVFVITGASLSLDKAWVECLAVQQVGQVNG